MGKHGIWLVCFFASLASAVAQVTVEVDVDQDQFLSGEALPTAVRITNLSGRSIRLGADSDWLTFLVEGRNNLIVRHLGDVPVVGEFVLDTSKRATKHVNLAPYFSVGAPGHYTVTATVRIRDWNYEVSSPPTGFDVIEGTKLWEQEFGVPNSDASGGVPEVRKYILQQANHLRTGLALYLRVTDATGSKPYRVVRIGGMLSFSRPEAQVDRDSRLQVLYQNQPHSFGYFVYNTSGELVGRQTYDYVKARPRLQPDGEGNISVLGGVRHPAETDLPPAKPPTTLSEAAPQPPSPSNDVSPPKR